MLYQDELCLTYTLKTNSESKFAFGKITLLIRFKFRDIDTVTQDEWKEAIRKSAKVEMKRNKAQEKNGEDY